MKINAIYSSKSLEIFNIEEDNGYFLSVHPEKVSAGGYSSFESPANDFPEDSINLMSYLIKDKDTTFFVRVKGQCLEELGIFDNSLLVVQKDILPNNNDTFIVNNY